MISTTYSMSWFMRSLWNPSYVVPPQVSDLFVYPGFSQCVGLRAIFGLGLLEGLNKIDADLTVKVGM